MLFYVNVQNKTKYKYESLGGVSLGDYAETQTYHAATKTRHTKVLKGANAAEIAYQKNRAMKSGTHIDSERLNLDGSLTDKAKKGVSAAFNNTKRIQESIALYLPPNVEDNTTAGYNDFRTGLAGYLVATGINVMNQPDAEGIAKTLLSGTGMMLDAAAKKAVSEISEMALGAEGTTQLMNKAFGQADNPYMEVLFDAMALRSFTYNFTFAPRNERETAEVQKIIQVFRFHMAPELQGAQSRFLTLPSQFDIHYMYLPMGNGADNRAMENSYYNRVATCVLQNCTVNYTPDGVKSFADGAPTKITMALQFKETELLTKERINEGY